MNTIPKSLQYFADKNNLGITILTFKCQGIPIKRKGYCFHRKEIVEINGIKFHYVVCELEPIEDNSKDKWYLCTVPTNFENRQMSNHARYFEKISGKMFANVDVNCNSYMVIEALKKY